ncbi:hypothetical protein NUW58_g6562 [Xylaria curta]|uniref:Uncharacterized protein n=1 Tax=Xylaria curta TaxID=42375 RepID=A0ACC1NRL0_9PEZI|nr:hypothetical protein NUW58_g6562 [Xylaria curta]
MRSASARSYAHVAATRYDYPSGPSRALDESYPFYHSSTHGRSFRDEDPWDLYQPSHRHTSHRTAYDDQSHTKYYSSHRSTSSREAGNRDEHTTSSAATQPGHVVDDIPLSIQQALIKGKRDVHDLKGVFNVVLLYEWCMTEDGKIPNAPSKFDTAFKLLPVKRNNVGGYQPIESTHSSWGVKSGYYPEYDTYLATILIRVPDTLPEVSGRAMERAYARFALKPRIDKLKEILAIPFVNHPQYRNYAILFKFGSECEKYRLFDDHLREDTVIRMK